MNIKQLVNTLHWFFAFRKYHRMMGNIPRYLHNELSLLIDPDSPSGCSLAISGIEYFFCMTRTTDSIFLSELITNNIPWTDL